MFAAITQLICHMHSFSLQNNQSKNMTWILKYLPWQRFRLFDFTSVDIEDNGYSATWQSGSLVLRDITDPIILINLVNLYMAQFLQDGKKGANFVLLCPSSWKLCFDYFPYFGFLSSSFQVTAVWYVVWCVVCTSGIISQMDLSYDPFYLKTCSGGDNHLLLATTKW